MVKKTYIIEIRDLHANLTEWLTSMDEIRYDANELIKLVLDRFPLPFPPEEHWSWENDKIVFQDMYRLTFLELESIFHEYQIRGEIREVKFSLNFVYVTTEEQDNITL